MKWLGDVTKLHGGVGALLVHALVDVTEGEDMLVQNDEEGGESKEEEEQKKMSKASPVRVWPTPHMLPFWVMNRSNNTTTSHSSNSSSSLSIIDYTELYTAPDREINKRKKDIENKQKKFLDHIRTSFGPIPNTEHHIWRNIRDNIAYLTTQDYTNNPYFHNLCPHITVPPETEKLLSLGGKFCLQKIQPPNDINKSLHRFSRDIRIKCLFHNNNNNNSGTTLQGLRYIPSLYLRSNTEINRSTVPVETALDNLHDVLTKIQAAHRPK